MKVVVAENIDKSYSHLKALNNINLSVEEGELFGLIGPDGAGKTTLFRIMATLLLADKGKITMLGKDIVNDYKWIRNQIGYMPGRFSLYQDLSVEENINFFATIFGTSLEENYDLVKPIYSQIEPFKTRKAGKLSGGMKQKLALSCALIHKPQILILDEPTTGVDAVSRKEFWEMLKSLNRVGITILVSTPYMDEASLCDRVALIQKGKIMTVDIPEAITRKLDKTIYELDTENMYRLLLDMEKYKFTHSIYPFGLSAHYIDKRNVVNPDELISYLELKGHSGIKVSKINATVEDCFMELMTQEHTNDD